MGTALKLQYMVHGIYNVSKPLIKVSEPREVATWPKLKAQETQLEDQLQSLVSNS